MADLMETHSQKNGKKKFDKKSKYDDENFKKPNSTDFKKKKGNCYACNMLGHHVNK